MSKHDGAVSSQKLNSNELLVELEVPFAPDQVRWRVVNTDSGQRRGQLVPYADPRAYSDRLNALLTPRGWTREYRIQTVNNISRMARGESILTGRVLVACTVTIIGLASHSGTGEEWADDANAMTSADAQAFKRACSCFGMGRYLYDVIPCWVDLDQNRRPRGLPALPAWAIPQNWRNGMRPPNRNGDCHSPGGQVPTPPNRSGNGGGTGGDRADRNLDAAILRMKAIVGARLYRGILHHYGHANYPTRIRDATVKSKVLHVLESAARGWIRLDAVARRLGPDAMSAALARLQAPPLNQIEDMKTLERVVVGLEEKFISQNGGA